MKNKFQNLLIGATADIKDALEVLDREGQAIALVIDKNEKLIGTITDGDVRRALLRGLSINDSIESIIHYNPIIGKKNMTKDAMKDVFIKNAIKQLPIVDDNSTLVDLININDVLLPEGKENPVIIMAGGLGTRLKELTQEIPKPMLNVGQQPMLYHIIKNFKEYGYNKILISVNYKAEIIENYFQDGYAYGVKINYLREKKRLGTGGGIKLGKEFLDKSFFVINGDIFTNLNVESMMDFHIENDFDITVGTRKHSLQIPYGVINEIHGKILSIEEKPVIEYLINGGIYCLKPSVLEYIPENQYFEITDLIRICIEKGKKIGSYEIKDYWLDIGKIEDYHKVNVDIYDLVACEKVSD